MEREYTNGELGLLMEGLCDKVDTGFKGVHDRQDKTNGNVIRNTEFRLKATANINLLKWVVGLIGLTNVLAIVKLFIQLT